jgi:alpha-glucosidase
MSYKWWETTVFYQIYPRSFADGNDDGIGDIAGIIDKLDYLQWLGVNGIWLSPHYPSPQIDVGYDIADYTDVEPEYGTLDDFKRMLKEMHTRNMKLILDLVLNHTSHLHHWFQESRSSKHNPKREWYIWRDGVGGKPPNNWESEFGGSAWTYDETTDQWYYHYFLKEQPDLNWRNPAVKEAMFNAARFWLDLGVDGFRLDAIGTIYEDPDLTPHTSTYTALDALRRNWLHDEPDDNISFTDIAQDLFKYQRDLPEIFGLMSEFRDVIDTYDDRFLVGETSDIRYLGDGKSHLHSIFNFDLTFQQELSASKVREIHQEWRAKIPAGAWQSNTLNNHDQSRVFTHFAQGPHAGKRSRIMAAIPMLLEGIPFLYYGEEIGMEDYAVKSFNEVHDMVGDVYGELRLAEGVSKEQIVIELGKVSRDRCRTPMQWGGTANGGFSSANVQTWLPVHQNHTDGVNVAYQRKDESSLLHFYRNLIHIRNDNRALQVGAFVDYCPDNEDALVFLRQADEQTCLVAINFSAKDVSTYTDIKGNMLFSTTDRAAGFDGGKFQLAPFEILIVEVQ